ncbi:MAG: hypothetical protein WC682_01640 [Parcubacteria group bacterium]|jgi:hypothetical protein
MKLKFLLMPVSVIVSLVLIIWHIYPTWFGTEASSIKNIKIEIKKENDEISNIKQKRDNAIKLIQSLKENEESELLVEKYYPTYRNDEDVVNNINNIAFTEGVFLLNMGIDYKNIELLEDPVKVMALPLEKNPQGTVASTATSATAVAKESVATPAEVKSKIKYIKADLEIYGSYDQIKRFMISLNKAGLLNNVQSFKIYKKDNPESNVGESSEKASDVLNADLGVGFGYMISPKEEVASLLNKEMFNNSEFDFSSIIAKKDILTGNYRKSEIGETGSSNPFLSIAPASQDK